MKEVYQNEIKTIYINLYKLENNVLMFLFALWLLFLFENDKCKKNNNIKISNRELLE